MNKKVKMCSQLLFNNELGALASARMQRNKKHINGKGIKLALFADNIVIFVENPKILTKILSEPMSFRKVAGCKGKIQKIIIFSYTSNKQLEFEL